MQNTQIPVRVAGRDLMRSLAIALVILSHLPFTHPLEGGSVLGVELFFSLSGFLIAEMVWERFGCIAEWRSLKLFLANRWFRTLPLYFVALVACWLVANHVNAMAAIGRSPTATAPVPQSIVPYLFFFQNMTFDFLWPHEWFFAISWSLAAEEWFYVLLPLTLFIFRSYSPRRVLFALTIVAVTVAIGGRAMRFYAQPNLDFDGMYRTVTLFRLDTFCFGALAYLAMRQYGAALLRYRLLLFVSGLLAIAYIQNEIVTDSTTAFAKVFAMSLASLATAAMLPAFHAWEISSACARTVLRFVSTRTYALYLTHLPIALLFTVHVAPLGYATAVPYLVIVVVVSDAVYRYFERPILKLRPRSAAGSAAVPKPPTEPNAFGSATTVQV